MAAQRKPSLAAFFQDLLLLGHMIQTREVQLPACDVLRARVNERLQAVRQEAQRAGHVPAEVEQALYAVCAYLDEIIKSSDWPERERWSSYPLQAELFGESNAGMHFFDRYLPVVRRGSPQALEVFYLCVLMGFQGKYRMGSLAQLGALIEDLRREVGPEPAALLSPHGDCPGDTAGGGRGFPLVPLAGALVVVSLIIVVVLYLLVAQSRAESVQLLQRLAGG